MKTRRLGKNGFEVGEIGLGCWQLGGDWGPSLKEDTAFAILSAAVENGIGQLQRNVNARLLAENILLDFPKLDSK